MAHLILILGGLIKFLLMKWQGGYTIPEVEGYFPLSLADIFYVEPKFNMYSILSSINLFKIFSVLVWAWLVNEYLNLENSARTILFTYFLLVVIVAGFNILLASSEKGLGW